MGKEPETDTPVIESSGNVFADMGLPEAEEELTKAQLASHIRQVIKRRRLTRVAAAAVMSVDQPKVSALLNGRLANFSSERLMRLLTALGQDWTSQSGGSRAIARMAVSACSARRSDKHVAKKSIKAPQAEQEARLVARDKAPAARLPPAEERLLPLMVGAGAAGDSSGEHDFQDVIAGKVISGFRFG